MARAPFQVLVLPYRRRADGAIEYALFRRADQGVWQGIAGGGEDFESPEAAAAREAFEEAGIPSSSPCTRLASVGAVPVEHFADREAWSPALRTIPEYCFGVDVADHAIRVSPEHSAFQWLELGPACTLLEWASNRVALRELDAALRGRRSALGVHAV
jgi:dATP pyrophosphohydrolase